MRRARLGDVYAIHLNSGYKLFQWAYQIPQWGKYIRVFDGIYNFIPTNVHEIVQGKHAYIIGFNISKAYRIGLAQFVANIPVPTEYPFPNYRLDYWKHDLDNDFCAWIRPTVMHPSLNPNEIFSYDISSMNDLPSEFQKVDLLDCNISPSWLLYLFEYNFTLDNLMLFWPQFVLNEKKDDVMNNYQSRIDKLLNTNNA